jgi:hypothetical protein
MLWAQPPPSCGVTRMSVVSHNMSCHNIKAFWTKDNYEHKINPNSIQFGHPRYLRFENVTKVTININIFWHVTSCDITKILHRGNLNSFTATFLTESIKIFCKQEPFALYDETKWNPAFITLADTPGFCG